MGSSRQNAVKAFLDVVSCHDDDIMLDRWIPDEDWVRTIRENGERDCSILNLNKGLSAQCFWQNNHATIQGTTIFYNKKTVRTYKSKTTKKSISFYYVLSANKPPPSVPSDQGFYQSLWDDPDRSNSSLKRKANKRATSPPTKKAKASSPLTRALSPDSPQSSHEMPSPSHEKMPSPSDPQTFQCALDMLVTAWKEKYPTVKFQIGVN
jgi:hypothetical protein